MPGNQPSLSSRIRQHHAPVRNVLLSAAGILLFATFVHHSFPLLLFAIIGLSFTSVVIAISTRNKPFLESFGLGRPDRRALLFLVPALLLGVALGILTRRRFELSLIPAGFTGVVLVAPLIGAVEELVFRGYMQGHLRPAGKILSIVSASGIHTCYKLLVILTLALPLQFDFFFLIFWTFLGGLLFGTLRELSGSVVPPMLAHAVFDIVLYGGMAAAPVWVWS